MRTFIKIGSERIALDQIANYWIEGEAQTKIGFLLIGNSTTSYIQLKTREEAQRALVFIDSILKPVRMKNPVRKRKS